MIRLVIVLATLFLGLICPALIAWPDLQDWGEIQQSIYHCGASNGGSIALTFDDGPSPGYTPQVLNVLTRFGCKGTFFVQGAHVRRYPGLVRAIAAQGHELGNHTFSHPHVAELSEEDLRHEIEITSALISKLGLAERGLFRPPYSEVSEAGRNYMQESGRRLILWSIDAGDYLGLPGPQIAQRVLSQLKPGAIIVFHDNDEDDDADRQPTVEALEILLPRIQQMGLTCVTVSELLPLPGGPRWRAAAQEMGGSRPYLPVYP